MYKGSEQTDLGLRTDVIANIPKKLGIKIEISIKKSDIDSISKKLRELFGDKLIIK